MKMSRQESTLAFGPEIQKYTVSEECHHTDREKDTQKISYSTCGHTRTPHACTLVHTPRNPHARTYTHTPGNTGNLGENDASQHSAYSTYSHN